MAVATDSSRPGESIAEVKIDVRIDHPGQKPIQSIGLIIFFDGPTAYPESSENH